MSQFLLLILSTLVLSGCFLKTSFTKLGIDSIQSPVTDAPPINGSTPENSDILLDLQNEPLNANTNLTHSVDVISSTATTYIYKIGNASTTDCSDLSGYSTAQNITTQIPISISLITGDLVLCVWGINAKGEKQTTANIVRHVWTQSWQPFIYIEKPGQPIAISNSVSVKIHSPVNWVEMYLTENSACNAGGTWEAIANSKIMSVTPNGSNIATVYARFRDASGGVSSCYSATIEIAQYQTLSCTGNTTSNALIGEFVDDGGLGADYSDSADCSITLTSGEKVFTFNVLNTEDGYDFLTIYKNSISGSNILADLSGSSPPTPLASTNSTHVIRFTSDGSVTAPGFRVSWTTPTISQTTSISINAAATYTSDQNVTLTLVGIQRFTQMYITHDSLCATGGTWENISTTKAWQLTAASGTKSVYVKFRDPSSTESGCESDSIIYFQGLPTATLTGTPQAVTDDDNISITVGGTDVTSYRYKLGASASTDCADITAYAAPTSINNLITADISAYANGYYKLCVLGINPAGSVQTLTSATEFTWERSVPAELNFQIYETVANEGNSTLTLNLTLSQAMPHPITIGLRAHGTATAGVDFSFSTSSVTFAAFQTTTSVPIDLLDDSAAEAVKNVSIIAESISNAYAVLGSKYFHRIYIKDSDSASPNSPSKFISMGNQVFCVIDNDDKLKCWGLNMYGSVGNGTTTDVTSPTQIHIGTTYKMVSNFNIHTCGITTNDDLYCWGSNGWGQLGNGNTSQQNSPVLIDSGVKYKIVSVGEYSTCGVTLAGVLKCWGGNTYLGDGTQNNATVPTVIDAGTSYQFVKKSYNGTCAITDVGRLKCWGSNGSGQLGDGGTSNLPLPTVIDGSFDYKSVSTSTLMGCGLTTSNLVRCWGSGALGDGGAAGSNSLPVNVDNSQTYSSILVLDYNGVCGQTTTNKIKCWGPNSEGLLGDGTTISRDIPTLIDGTTDYIFLATDVGFGRKCAITTVGMVKCWGAQWQLSPDIPNVVLSPVASSIGLKFKKITGSSTSMCGISMTDELYCWGRHLDSSSSLGDGKYYIRLFPVKVDPGVTYSKIEDYEGSYCGITTAGVLKCWGNNYYHTLGDGTITSRKRPIVIDPGVSYSEVSLTRNGCGVTTTGVAKCWGDNTYSQLGDQTTVTNYLPVVADAGTTYSKIATNEKRACGITTAGALKCWGENTTGYLGNGNTTNQNVPIQIDVGTNYKYIYSAYDGFCAITTTNKIKCWGANSSGQLGNGTTTDITTPTLIDGGTDYQMVKVSSSASCAITTANKLMCWGYRPNGDGTFNNRLSPVAVDASTNYMDIARDTYSTSCVLTTGNDVKCWNTNLGKYGNGYGFTPVPSILSPISF